MNYYVYEITNNINGKKYIGKRSCHCKIEDDKYMGSGKYLWNSINHHGIENFSKEIIYVGNCEEEVYDWEEYLIEKYDLISDNNFYNLKSGGKGFRSRDLQGEKNHNYGGENLKGEKNPFYGKKHSEETKLKISLKNKGKAGPVFSLEQRREMSKRVSGSNNPMYGKIGELNPFYNKQHSEESRLKIKKALTGKKLTEKHRKNISNGVKKRFENPEERKKISNAVKGEKNPFYGKTHSEEVRKIISEAQKGRDYTYMKEAWKNRRETMKILVIQYDENMREIKRFHGLKSEISKQLKGFRYILESYKKSNSKIFKHSKYFYEIIE